MRDGAAYLRPGNVAGARPAPDAHAHTMLAQGAWVVGRDETTAIQARKAVVAPDPLIAVAPMRQSPLVNVPLEEVFASLRAKS